MASRIVTVRVETNYSSHELLQLALIRCVFQAAVDQLGFTVLGIQVVQDLDPNDFNSWYHNKRNHALVQFEVPKGYDFDPTRLQGEGHEIVTLISDSATF